MKIRKLLSMLLLLAGTALAQQETGNIFVTVTGADGEALPGATLVATGQYLMGSRNGVTNVDGRFNIRNLPAGSYEVTCTMAGFQTTKIEDIKVNIGSTTNLPIQLKVSTVEEVLTVTSSEPTIDLTTANTGQKFGVEELNKLPTTKDPWGVLEATPGVFMSQNNVGGNMQGTQARFSARGASPYQNAYFIDGVNLTDTSASGASGQYYDFESFSQISVSTSGHDASMGAPGVNVSMVTKSGSNQFEGRLSMVTSDSSWTSKNAIDVNGRELDASLDNNLDYNFSLGGPIVKDKLWFFAAYHHNEVDLFTPNTRYTDSPVIDATELDQLNANVKWAITPSNTLKFAYNENDKTKSNRLATYPSTVDYTLTPGAGWAQQGPGDAWYISDEWIINDEWIISAKAGEQNYPFTLGVHADAPADVLTRYPVHLNTNTGIATSGYNYPIYNRENQTLTLKASVFKMMGSTSHDISFGYDRLDSDNYDESVYPGNAIVYTYGSGTYSEAWFIRPVRKLAIIENQAIFLNDIITAGNWTFNLGVRYQSQVGSIGGGTVNAVWQNVPEEVAPGFAQRFGGFDVQPIDNAAEWQDFVPRVNVSWDINGDGKQVVKFGYNQYAYTLNTTDFEDVSALSEYEEDYEWTDLDGNGLFLGDGSDWDEIDFANLAWSSGSGSGTPIDDDYSAPRVDEIILNYSHEFDNAFVLSSNYLYRKNSDPTNTINRAIAGLQNWNQTTVTDNNGNTHDFYEFNGTYDVDNIITNQEGNSSTYHGIEIMAKKATSKYNLMGSVTWGSTDETIDLNQVDDPNTPLSSTRRADLAGAYASEWNVKLIGSYQFPWQLTVAGKVRYSSGNYFTTTQDFDNGLSNSTVIINGLENDHYPAYTMMDLGVIKNFNIGEIGQLELRLDIYNLLNENTITAYTSTNAASSNYQVGREILGPRIARLGAAFVF